MNKTSDNIPVVDVKGLTGEDEEQRHLAAQIRDAFANIGFVALNNHNISTDAVVFPSIWCISVFFQRNLINN